MSFHSQTRVQLATGNRELWCPYCQATAPHAVRSHVAFALHLLGGEVAA